MNTSSLSGDTGVSPAGQRVVSSNLWSTRRALNRRAQMPIGGQMKPPTAFQIRTLRALDRAHFRSVVTELEIEDMALLEECALPEHLIIDLEELPVNGWVN
jgi:hypothetical protein